MIFLGTLILSLKYIFIANWWWYSINNRSKVKLFLKKEWLKNKIIKLFYPDCLMLLYDILAKAMIKASLNHSLKKALKFFSEIFKKNPNNCIIQNSDMAMSFIILTIVTFVIYDVTMVYDISIRCALFQLRWIYSKYWFFSCLYRKKTRSKVKTWKQ